MWTNGMMNQWLVFCPSVSRLAIQFLTRFYWQLSTLVVICWLCPIHCWLNSTLKIWAAELWIASCNQTSTRPETLLPSVSPSTILLYRYIYSTYIHSLFGFPCIRPAVHSNQWTMYETMPLPFSACIHHVARVGHSCSSLFLRRRAIGNGRSLTSVCVGRRKE